VRRAQGKVPPKPERVMRRKAEKSAANETRAPPAADIRSDIADESRSIP